METQKAKIPFYVRRSFSEKLSTVIDFLRENWKPLIKFSTALILPLCLIQALSLNSIMSSYWQLIAMDDPESLAEALLSGSFLAQCGLLMLFYAIGSMMMRSIVYAIIQKYNESDGNIINITFAELRPAFMRNLGRGILAVLFITAFMIVYMILTIILATIHPFTFILTMPGIFAIMFPLALFIPIYLFEKIGLMGAFTKALRIGFATWGGIFAIYLVIGLMASVLHGTFSVPWYVLFGVKNMLIASDMGSVGDVSTSYKFALYVLGILQVYGYYISMIFIHLGLAYQYAHATEKADNISFGSDIENFDQL